MIEAIESGESSRVAELLAAGADPRATLSMRHGEATAASLALADFDAFKALVDAAGPAGLEGQLDGALLRQAVANMASLQIVKLLMGAGGESMGAAARGEELMQAVCQGRQDVACEMARRGWGAAVAGPALALCAGMGQRSLVALLLERGASPNAKRGESGGSALRAAARGGHAEVCDMLLEAGADPNERVEQVEGSILAVACAGGGPSAKGICEALIKAGADVERRGEKETSALMRAAASGNHACVEALLAAGAEVDARDEKGGTALMWACATGGAESVKLLIAAGADPGAAANGPKAKSPGVTAAMICCERGRSDCLSLLIEAGADVEAKDMAGRSVREWIDSARDGRGGDKAAQACEAIALSAMESAELSRATRAPAPTRSKPRRGI